MTNENRRTVRMLLDSRTTDWEAFIDGTVMPSKLADHIEAFQREKREAAEKPDAKMREVALLYGDNDDLGPSAKPKTTLVDATAAERVMIRALSRVGTCPTTSGTMREIAGIERRHAERMIRARGPVCLFTTGDGLSRERIARLRADLQEQIDTLSAWMGDLG